MEDVQLEQRMAGVTIGAVSMKQLNEMEWKVGDMKLGPDEVEATGLRLASMHFGSTSERGEKSHFRSFANGKASPGKDGQGRGVPAQEHDLDAERGSSGVGSVGKRAASGAVGNGKRANGAKSSKGRHTRTGKSVSNGRSMSSGSQSSRGKGRSTTAEKVRASADEENSGASSVESGTYTRSSSVRKAHGKPSAASDPSGDAQGEASAQKATYTRSTSVRKAHGKPSAASDPSGDAQGEASAQKATYTRSTSVRKAHGKPSAASDPSGDAQGDASAQKATYTRSTSVRKARGKPSAASGPSGDAQGETSAQKATYTRSTSVRKAHGKPSAASDPSGDAQGEASAQKARGSKENGRPRSHRSGVDLAHHQSIQAMCVERINAERAFDKMDQSWVGKIATSRFDDLLALLGIPESPRKRSAKESARAAGLLSSYSFTRPDFITWYLEWVFPKDCESRATKRGVEAASVSASSPPRPPVPLSTFGAWRRSDPPLNSPSSSDSDSSTGIGGLGVHHSVPPAMMGRESMSDSFRRAEPAKGFNFSAEQAADRSVASDLDELSRLLGSLMPPPPPHVAGTVPASTSATAPNPKQDSVPADGDGIGADGGKEENEESQAGKGIDGREDETRQAEDLGIPPTPEASVDSVDGHPRDSEATSATRESRAGCDGMRGDNTSGKGEDGKRSVPNTKCHKRDASTGGPTQQASGPRSRVGIFTSSGAGLGRGIVPPCAGDNEMSPAKDQSRYDGVLPTPSRRDPERRRGSVDLHIVEDSGPNGERGDVGKGASVGFSAAETSSKCPKTTSSKPTACAGDSVSGDMMDISESPPKQVFRSTDSTKFTFRVGQSDKPKREASRSSSTSVSATVPATPVMPTPRPVATPGPAFVFGPKPTPGVKVSQPPPLSPSQSETGKAVFGNILAPTPGKDGCEGSTAKDALKSEDDGVDQQAERRPSSLFTFGSKSVPMAPAAPATTGRGATFAAGAVPCEQRDGSRRARGRKPQRGRPISASAGSSATPPPPPGRHDRCSASGAQVSKGGVDRTSGFWGSFSNAFTKKDDEAGIGRFTSSPMEPPAATTSPASTTGDGIFSFVFSRRESNLPPPPTAEGGLETPNLSRVDEKQESSPIHATASGHGQPAPETPSQDDDKAYFRYWVQTESPADEVDMARERAGQSEEFGAASLPSMPQPVPWPSSACEQNSSWGMGIRASGGVGASAALAGATASINTPQASWFKSCVNAATASESSPTVPSASGNAPNIPGGVGFDFGVSSNGLCADRLGGSARLGDATAGGPTESSVEATPQFSFGESSQRSEVDNTSGDRGFSFASGLGIKFNSGQQPTTPAQSGRGQARRRPASRTHARKPHQPHFLQSRSSRGVATTASSSSDLGDPSDSIATFAAGSTSSGASRGPLSSPVGGGRSCGQEVKVNSSTAGESLPGPPSAGFAEGVGAPIMQAWLKGKEDKARREREEREAAEREEQRRRDVAAELDRLRRRHEADKEKARRTYMESKSFEAAAQEYTNAISSLERLLDYLQEHGEDNPGTRVSGDTGRGRLAPLYWSRAAAHIMIGRYRSAVADCELALEMEPLWVQAYPRMGKAFLMAGELEEADRAYQVGTVEQPSSDSEVRLNRECRQGTSDVRAVRVHLENASVALRKGQYDRAVESADRALALSPNNQNAQKYTLEAFNSTWKWEEARKRCEIWAFKLERCNSTMGITNLAGFGYGGGPPRVCIRSMHPALREGYCKVLRNGGRLEEFKEALDEALVMRAPWAGPMCKRRDDLLQKKQRAGEAYAKQQYDRACELYAEALALDPEDCYTKAVLYANRAAALMNRGRNKEALRDCQAALKLKSNYPRVVLRKARIHKRLGHWAEAIKEYETYRNAVGIKHETWREAADELDECRMSQRQAREEERKSEARARERRFLNGRAGSSRRWFEDDAYPTESDDDYNDSYFYGPFSSAAAGAWSERSSGARSSSRRTGADAPSAEAIPPPTGHYRTLGIQQNATAAEVKKAYRKLALQYHPDKNSGDAALAERFKEVREAYEILSDEQERRTYDASLRLAAHSSRWR